MVRVRGASAADEEAVTAQWRLCGLIAPYNDPEADFRRARGQASSDVLVAETEQHGVCATAMMAHDCHPGWMYYVAVRPEFQFGGTGRRIMAKAESWFRTRHVPRAQLMGRATNKRVTGFNTRLGFEPSDLLVMQKPLAPSCPDEPENNKTNSPSRKKRFAPRRPMAPARRMTW